MPRASKRNSFPRPKALALGLVALAVASVTAAFSFEVGGKREIKPVPRSEEGATGLARQIFQGNRTKLAQAKFVTVPPGGAPAAVSDKRISGFPGRGKSFAILSTGCARLADNPNKSGSSGCRDGGVKVRGARDVTIWRIGVRVPKGNDCLSFRFKFLSEEYREYVGSIYNDAFIAELSRSPRWDASGSQDPTITAPRSFATTRDGKLISVNGTGVARVTKRAAKGTTFDAATGKLRASTPIKPGKHLLHLSIFDQGDREFDSAVFIDRLTVRDAKKCRSGVVKTK